MASTRFLTGLVGRDIQASRSPWLHEQEADALGVRLVYSLFDFAADGLTGADLPRLLDAARMLGVVGLNVTYPYKQAILPHLDALSDAAARIGSVNTVQFTGGRMIGHNTDVIGFGEGVRTGLTGVALDRVVQMGAGGAGAATAHALIALGVGELTLFDTDAGRRDALVEALGSAAQAGENLKVSLAAADGIVNATPLGMHSYPGSSIPLDLIRSTQWVSDIVYFPLETELLRTARERGCRTLDGSIMVVFQAAAAFDIFTGLTADRARMLRSFRASLDA